MQRHPHTLAPRADTAPLEGITVLRPGAAGLQFCKLYSPDVVGGQLAASGAPRSCPEMPAGPLAAIGPRERARSVGCFLQPRPILPIRKKRPFPLQAEGGQGLAAKVSRQKRRARLTKR